MSPLISPAELAAKLGQPDLRVFDATYYLPTEGLDPRALFAEAHVPGARFFDIDRIADQDTDLPHMVPAAGRFAKLVGELGIGNDSDVVVYDQRAEFGAARAWWMLRLFGHDRVAVLDGGLARWRAEGHPTESGTPGPPAPARFRPTFRAHLLRGVGDMLANLEANRELVVDVRAAARFAGSAPEPRPGVRAGHIPGAVNLPFRAVLRDDNTFRPVAELRAVLAGAGVDGSRPVVASCGSGVSACILALAAAQAGLPAVAVYDGSWTEWGGRDDTPVATGS